MPKGIYKKTEEHKRKISESISGTNHPNYGKHLSEETKKKISSFHIGKKLSKEHIANIIKFHAHLKGEESPMYGFRHTKETKNKISIKQIGKHNSPSTEFKTGRVSLRKGIKLSKEQIEFLKKLSKGNKYHEGFKHSKEVKEKIKQARAKQIFPAKNTTIEVKIQKFLEQLSINYFQHKYIKEIQHGYQCDFLIPSMNLIIECDGDYWHNYPMGREIDKIRTNELLEKGFKVLRLWEFEIKEMNINKFKQKIMEFK